MFHIILITVYTIPNIYLYFRIRKLFISRDYRWHFTIIYLLAVLIYPVSQFFEHREMNFLMQAISIISGYLLPFFLYLFLAVLAYEIFLLINLLVRVIPQETRKLFRYRSWVLTSMMVIALGIVIGGVINLNTIRTTQYTLTDVETIKPIKIVFVSDIHVQQNLNSRFMEKLSEKINALKPDLVLFGGDIVEGSSDQETTNRIAPLLARINSVYGSFGVPGNHEYYGGDGQNDFYRASNIELLHDTIIRINNICYVAGRNDQHTGDRKTVEKLFRNQPDDLPVILLDHRPTSIQEVSNTIADIQLSGHTHNGQLFPFNFITRKIYKISWGHRKINNTHFIVSSGLRLWGPPVKTAGKAEIVLIYIGSGI